MKHIKRYLVLSSIFGLVLGSSPVKAESFIEDACAQIVQENHSPEIVQVVLDDEPTSVSSDTSDRSDPLPQLAENLGLIQQDDGRWTCKYFENRRWFGLFDLYIKKEEHIMASTFLLDGKFKPNQKDAAISFLTNVVSETLSLGEQNRNKVKEALAGHLTLIDEGTIIPEQLDRQCLLELVPNIEVSSSGIPSSIPNSWLSHNPIPVPHLVVFDARRNPQAIASTYVVPIVDVKTKEIIKWGINITVNITTGEGFNVQNPGGSEGSPCYRKF
ncbi:hypothetical protein [Crocosphaera sp. Alani8]|uniref:hypothetical protein n=1 Tax=Crocosphaera sp. Alani8 TaxID=3038952 RepID=UPI00313EF7CA